MQKLEILALCNYADYSQNGALNISGIIDQITSTAFPSVLTKAYVVFTITGNKPNSKTSAKVKIVGPNATNVLTQDLELPVGGNGKSNFLVELVNLPLLSKGKYTISIESNSLDLGNTVFDVLDAKKDGK